MTVNLGLEVDSGRIKCIVHPSDSDHVWGLHPIVSVVSKDKILYNFILGQINKSKDAKKLRVAC